LFTSLFCRPPFATFGLSLGDWVIILCATATIIPVLESGKWLVRHKVFGELDAAAED